MDYTPPDNTNIPFKFTKTGYNPPNLGDVKFNLGSIPSMGELRAAIVGMELERDYLKSCEEYVVGFNQNNIQIIRHSCVYGGIRDLNVNLDVLSHFRDLPAYLKQTYAGQNDVFKTIRGWAKESLDLGNILKGWKPAYSDLGAFLRQGYYDDTDISIYIKSFIEQQNDLRNTVRGWSTGNVIDIINTIRAWHKVEIDLPTYVKSTTKDEVDLPTIVYKIWQHQQDSIDFALHGWQEAQLQKIIQALHIKDLPVLIRSTYFTNLEALLYAIQPVDISADLVGWAYGDLPAYIVDGVYEGDLPTNIFGVAPKDLIVKIYALLGQKVPIDLNARMTNLSVYNLGLVVNPMQYMDLNILLASSRHSMDLTFKIYPKLVNVKHHINIAFLEHRDLAGIINFPCFSSAFRDLAMTLTVKHSKDMRFYIYGYDYSNIKDLSCSINASDYISKDTIDITYLTKRRPETHTVIRFTNKSRIFSINTVNILSNVFTRAQTELSMAINGTYLTRDLPVFIRAYANRHASSSNVHEKFVTLKLKNNQEDFRRYVEMTFNSYAKEYSYFSGSQRAYRNHRNDHWVIRVEGHKLLPVGRGFEKSKVRRKYIFNLKNYPTIDDALKDMIDRVTMMKFRDLGVFIESTNDRVANLSAYVRAKRIFKSNRVLAGIIRGGRTLSTNLPTVLIATLHKGDVNLTSSITGVEYGGASIGEADFNFVGQGDVDPIPTDVTFEFDIGDIDGNN